MKTLAIFIFPHIQTLDLFGPIEMLGAFQDKITLTLVAQTKDPLQTRHGQWILPDAAIDDGHRYDFLLIPGGDSAIEAGRSQDVLDWLSAAADHAERVMTVCTGSILLAMTGRLDGKQATTNKVDFRATTPLAPKVNWVAQARWVEDGKFITSSGVSAGMDMALRALALIFSQEDAHAVADDVEYEWHSDPAWDPFAVKEGLL